MLFLIVLCMWPWLFGAFTTLLAVTDSYRDLNAAAVIFAILWPLITPFVLVAALSQEREEKPSN